MIIEILYCPLGVSEYRQLHDHDTMIIEMMYCPLVSEYRQSHDHDTMIIEMMYCPLVSEYRQLHDHDSNYNRNVVLPSSVAWLSYHTVFNLPYLTGLTPMLGLMLTTFSYQTVCLF